MDDRTRSWWVGCVGDISNSERFVAAFAGAGRHLGAAPVVLTEVERSQLEGSEFAGLIHGGLPLSELGRIALLRTALGALPRGEHEKLVDDVYRLGGHEEKIAVLRALCTLPEPARFIEIAAEGVRTNAVEILAAIAADNPYPARHFSFDAFNQLVMKVVFNNLSLSKIVGLSSRTNTELARMARDFADERRAAARPVPSDLHLIADFSQPETQK